MARNIMICFDGTCNHPADAKQEREWFGLGDIEDNGITNILKLHLLFGGNLTNSTSLNAQPENNKNEQYSFYYSGVGTYGNKIQKIFNAGFAPEKLDVGRILKSAIKDLKSAYQAGDNIYLFGFSRGAAIARRFAVIIDQYINFQDDRPIKFAGIFDTVASIGIPNLKDENKPISDVVFENNCISIRIESALHLLSLDEKRTAFMPTLMDDESRINEVWFAGAHADVGGGFWYDGLSDITLDFVIKWLHQHHNSIQLLATNEINYQDLKALDGSYEIDEEDLLILPNVKGTNHSQDRWWPIARATLCTRELRIHAAKQEQDVPLIHSSVIERFHQVDGYRPKALKGKAHRIFGEDIILKGLNAHR